RVQFQAEQLVAADPPDLVDGGVEWRAASPTAGRCDLRGFWARRHHRRGREDQVDEVATSGLDGVPDDQQTADLCVHAGFLTDLPAGRLHEGLPHLPPSPRQQPVPMRTLAVGDQPEPFGGGKTDGDPDAGLHVTDYRRNLDSERVFAL